MQTEKTKARKECPVCELVFYSAQRLQQHMQTHSPTVPPNGTVDQQPPASALSRYDSLITNAELTLDALRSERDELSNRLEQIVKAINHLEKEPIVVARKNSCGWQRPTVSQDVTVPLCES